MSTHLPGFQSFFFVLAKLATSSIRVNSQTPNDNLHLKVETDRSQIRFDRGRLILNFKESILER